MPFKANQDRRHHIPKQRHRVTNWAAYDIALRQRGSLTVWFTEATIAAWQAEPRATRGGQPRYSALAITTALTLRAVFRLALRQGRQRCPQSADSEGGPPEEDCTTKEIRDAEVNVLSMCGEPGPRQVLWPSLATRAREYPTLRVLLGAVNDACTRTPRPIFMALP